MGRIPKFHGETDGNDKERRRSPALIRFIAMVVGLSFAGAYGYPSHAQGSLDARVAKLERQLSSRALFEIIDRLNALQRELRQLRGDLELQSHEMSQLRDRQREVFVELDKLNGAVEKSLGAGSSADPTGVAVAGTNATASGATPVAPADKVDATETSRSAVRMPNQGPATGVAMTPPAPNGPVASTGPAPNVGSDVRLEPGRLPPPQSQTSGSGTTGPAVGGNGDDLSEQRDYQAAFNLLKEARYEKAAGAFTTFLGKYPAGRYADNAQYWLAESFYVTRDFPRSMKEFQTLVGSFPGSSKIAGAKLKIGFIHHELGRLAEAEKALVEVTTLFPGSTAARLASDRLKRIRSRASQN